MDRRPRRPALAEGRRRQRASTIFLRLLLLPALAAVPTAASPAGNLHKSLQLLAEPPPLVQFSNSTGAHLQCEAKGQPEPSVTWLLGDGTRAAHVPGLRHVTAGGSLVFPPFKAENYRQDVHAVTYRCAAANTQGTLLSRDVTVRGVVLQPYEVHVYDVYVIKGNTAVFRYHVPALLMDYVHVTSWIMDDSFVINKTDVAADTSELKFIVTSTGELYVRNASMDDVKKTFRCQTTHQLTGQTKLSSTSGKLIVTDPRMSVLPRITDQRSEVGFTTGETAFLRCVAEGHPPPHTEWYLKEPGGQQVPLPLIDKYQVTPEGLLIRSLSREDGGTFVCVASNAIGTEKAETTLTVTASLRVLIAPEVATADVGATLSIKCNVSGFPVSSVTWTKDGRPADSIDDVTLSGTTLVLGVVRSFHRGLWQCFARNPHTSTHGTFELILGDAPPELVSVFDRKLVHPGSALSIGCAAVGTPTPQLTMTQDGIPSTKAKSHLDHEGVIWTWINSSHVRSIDAGVYACRADNKAGSKSHAARINVYGKLMARQVPPVPAISGNDVAVYCPFIGYPFDSITWEKDGARLPVDIQQEVLQNGTLIIRKVQRSTDAGRYSCTVTKQHEETVSATIELVVMVPPKITPFSFREDVVREDTRTRLQCLVSEGDPPLSIRWLKDDQPIQTGQGIVIRELDEYSSMLTINNVTPTHDGTYTCVASNAAATVVHDAILSVNVQPTWIVEPRDTTVRVGASFMLNCQAKGFPIPSVQWMRVEGNNPSGSKFKVSAGGDVAILYNNSLETYKATHEHQGFYYCTADNGVGKGLSKVIYVKVQTPVYFEVKDQEQAAKIGGSVLFHCEAFGDRPISFEWFHRSKPISAHRNSRYTEKILNMTEKEGVLNDLTIHSVEKADGGDYVCKARNLYGEASTSYNLMVQEPPDVPEVLVVKNLGDRSVELSWNVPFDGNSGIIQYLLQYKRKQDSWQARSILLELEGGSTSTVVKGLQPATVYEFRVAAENSVGRSRFSNVVTVALGEEAPEGPPQEVEVEALDPDALRITWKPPKKSHWNGAIRGYYIGHRVVGSDQPFSFSVFEVPVEYTDSLIFQLVDLKRYSQYDIIVQAYNNGGRGPSSEPVVAMTSEGVPHLPPQDLRCSTLSTHSIYVVWDPPPSDAVNGILRGYKVFYKTVEEWYDSSMRSNVTELPRFTLQKLDVNKNYSIQILAYTRMGEGAKSDPIYCKTLEEVPGPPDAIKALPSSAESVLVSWKPPKQPNGFIIRYNVYYKLHGEGDEVDGTYTSYIKDGATKSDDLRGINVHNLEPEFTCFEVKRLLRDRRYAFWVTAISSIGEGPSSTIVIQSPASSFVAARCASFDDIVNTAWKKDILLACMAVGIPVPKRIWKRGTRIIRDNERVMMRFDGSLLLKNVDDLDSGNYTCRVENQYGQDEVQYSLNVQVPPPSPVLNVLSKSLTSITLQWTTENNGGDPIRGFILNYKREIGQWEKKDLPAHDLSYTLENLSCGSTYLIYLEAYNTIGVGAPCDIETVTTEGEAFVAPSKAELIREGATFITVQLDAWPLAPCPVLFFTAEFRNQLSKDWVNVPGNYKPSAQKMVISGLDPTTRYKLRLTAHSTGEPNRAEYEFSTLTPGGGTMPPNVIQKEEKIVYFSVDPWIFIPLVVLVITVIIASVVVCIFLVRRHNSRRDSTGVLPPPWPPEDHGTLTRSRPELGVSVESFVHLQRNAGNTLGRTGTLRRNREDPSPYASVQVFSHPANPEMMLQLMDKRHHPPPLPPCPEDLPPGREKWIVEAYETDPAQIGFHTWDQGYSSADGENIYATTSRPPIPPNPPDVNLVPNIINRPTEETTFVFSNTPNEPGFLAGVKDPSISPRPREPMPGENAWLLGDSARSQHPTYPPRNKEDIY